MKTPDLMDPMRMPGKTAAPAGAALPLAIDNLQAGYGRHRILHGVTAAALRPGTVTALLGPNGSGKSTLLKALGGLARVSGGRILLGGTDLARQPPAERARHIVYMPQALPRPVHLTVFESVVIAAHAGDRSRRTGAELERIARLLRHLGIDALAGRHLDELSGGQRQLAGLAQALARRPRVLLLDEPLSALDLNYQFHVMQLLRRETREHGLVTVVVLHDLDSALRHADHALLLRHGRILADGAPHDVISPATLAEAYGVRGRVDGHREGSPHVHVEGLVHDRFAVEEV